MIFKRKLEEQCYCCRKRKRTRILLMDDNQEIPICDECVEFLKYFMEFVTDKWSEIVSREVVVRKKVK